MAELPPLIGAIPPTEIMPSSKGPSKKRRHSSSPTPQSTEADTIIARLRDIIEHVDHSFDFGDEKATDILGTVMGMLQETIEMMTKAAAVDMAIKDTQIDVEMDEEPGRVSPAPQDSPVATSVEQVSARPTNRRKNKKKEQPTRKATDGGTRVPPRALADAPAPKKAEEVTPAWTTIVKKSRAAPANVAASARPKTARQKPAAVLVKVAPQKTFAETVATTRKVNIDFGALGVDGAKLKKTRTGDLLVELTGGDKSAAATEKLRDVLAHSLGTSVGAVTSLGVITEVEIVDIDAAASSAEVLEALRAHAVSAGANPVPGDSIVVTGMWATRFGQQVATAKIPKTLAAGLERLRVGWTMCRVRARRSPPSRCFKCHGFGHQSRDCKGADMADACRRCGEKGHKEANCQAGSDRCVACERAGLPRTVHRPGSGSCGARKQAFGRKPATPRETR